MNQHMRLCRPMLLLLGALMVSTSSGAGIPSPWEAFPRAHRSDFYLFGQYLDGGGDIEYNGTVGPITLKMNDTGLGGFGFGYHLNDFLALRLDFGFGGADFTAKGEGLPPGGSKRDAWLQTGKFNLDYNIINRRLTPLVTAGIGYQWTTVELDNLPDGYECWWDPWWGYVCYYDESVYSEVVFSWNVGAGLRWDIKDNLFLKAVGGATWLQYEDSKNIITQLEGIFVIGLSF